MTQISIANAVICAETYESFFSFYTFIKDTTIFLLSVFLWPKIIDYEEYD